MKWEGKASAKVGRSECISQWEGSALTAQDRLLLAYVCPTPSLWDPGLDPPVSVLGSWRESLKASLMSEGHSVQVGPALSTSWFADSGLLIVSSHACFGPEWRKQALRVSYQGLNPCPWQ